MSSKGLFFMFAKQNPVCLSKEKMYLCFFLYLSESACCLFI